MQREPVPSGLIGRKRLAAPLAVHPRLSADLYRLVVEGENPGRLEKRLTVIIGRLSAFGFFAVAGVALKNERMIGFETQRVTEVPTRSRQFKRCDVHVGEAFGAVHVPGIDPGMKRMRLDTGLADAAARECFAAAVDSRARRSGMPHPDLLVGPAFLLRARRHRLPKQRPLHAIGGARGIPEVRRHVPPLDAILRMRAMIGWKCQHAPGHHGCKSFGVAAETGKALRQRRSPVERQGSASPRQRRGARCVLYRSSAKILTSLAGCMRASFRTGSSAARKAASMATARSSSSCSGNR